MGLFQQLVQGSQFTFYLNSYNKVLVSFYDWWFIHFTYFITENLTRILLLSPDESRTMTEITEFRKRFDLVHDEITDGDIARFKSLKIYQWLLNDVIVKYHFLLSQDEISALSSSLEDTIMVSISAVSNFSYIISNKEMYNIFISGVISSLVSRFDTYSIQLQSIKRKFFASVMIQRQWRECNSNPSYMICQKRLLREITELVDDT
jgi:hypothetical protein